MPSSIREMNIYLCEVSSEFSFVIVATEVKYSLCENYIYRGDFYHESKGEPHVEEQLVANIYDLTKYNVELHEIVIFVSKSPCFHQDCDPKCEVVDECKSNKACAKLLGLLLSK
ncbi:hypothetical protein TELCIR_24444, partial [Teladorsagia circumcincta]